MKCEWSVKGCMMKNPVIMAIIVTAISVNWFTLRDSWAEDIAFIHHDYSDFGTASWYGAKYKGRFTASGERFDPSDLTAAHPTLPMGTLVEVSRPDQDRSVVVRINDRGPGGGRILDVSEAAARRLGMVALGTAQVSLRVIGMAK